MPDKEKVIQALEHHEQGVCIKEDVVCPYWEHKECVSVLCKDVLALLREQEPVAPRYKDPYHAYCGACGCRIPLKIKARYCRKCGRGVKWDDAE